MNSKNQINEEQAAIFLATHYKEISTEIKSLSSDKNFAGMFQAIVNQMRSSLDKGEFSKLIKYLKYTSWTYKRGNEYLQYIIENLFVRSFESIRKKCTNIQWQRLYKKIPKPLKLIYLTQNNIKS